MGRGATLVEEAEKECLIGGTQEKAMGRFGDTGRDRGFPETTLRSVWERQQFDTSRLQTSDGQPVSIFSPGRANNDAGPDFLDARIRVGRIVYRGDVELHTRSGDWHDHRHSSDPHYNRVILHVVLTADDPVRPAKTASARIIPLLVLHPFLDDALYAVLDPAPHEPASHEMLHLPCEHLNDHVEARVIAAWLDRLAGERIEMKIRRCEERLKQLIEESRGIVREPYPRYYGNPDEIPLPHTSFVRRDFIPRGPWEQLLYERIMEAMGFSKNRGPFLRLAQSMRLEFLRTHRLDEPHTMMALLFGSGGLLPSSRGLPEKESRLYVISLRKRWRELRPMFKGPVGQEGDWLFFRLRPRNFPTARLAACSYLLPGLFGKDGLKELIHIFKEQPQAVRTRIDRLTALFRIQPDEFWKHHYHFRGRRSPSGISLGVNRVHGIIINAIIPTVLLYARIFKDNDVRNGARIVMAHLPPEEQNWITKLLQRQLLRGKMAIPSSIRQQGALQLFGWYCTHRRCHECEVGKRTTLGRIA